MNIVAIIVARNGSSRIPGKSMVNLSGKPLIWHMIRITKAIKSISKVCLATSDLDEDNRLASIAKNENIELYRGDPENVLDRIFNASSNLDADVIVYIGGDCPLLDPFVVSDAIDYFIKSNSDYLNNYEPPTFPGGQDINIISFSALKMAYDEAIAPSQRIHAFSYLTFHSEKFKTNNYVNNVCKYLDIDTYHWYIDYPEDIVFIQEIYNLLYKENDIINIQDVLKLIETNNKLYKLNNDLKKPRVKHSFFSSPGIMEDISNDIQYLNKKANKFILEKDFSNAEKFYYEISCITSKLSNIKINK